MTDLDIYFAASIRGGRSDAPLYADVVELLRGYGSVLSEHVGAENVESREESAGLSDADIHDQDTAWLRTADAVVAEVTTLSLGVGYELGRAVEWHTPVLALYRPDGEHELSAMVRGSTDIRVAEYRNRSELPGILDGFLPRDTA